MQTAAAPGSVFDALATLVRGRVLQPADPAYDETRKIHNGMIDRKPAAIVRCEGVADVVAAVRFAREKGLHVSVRGGGHGVPGFAVCEGGLMIDLSASRGVRVDAARRTARAMGGTTWGEVDHETHAYGLATVGGTVRTTGIAGLTLSGGHGMLMRKYALACDNLLSADVVTADGRIVTASAQENPDLFWGLRGGGGNFGVVTSFEYQLHPLSTVLGGLLIFPFDHARGVIKAYDEFMATAPDELGAAAVLGTLPDGAKVVVLLVVYAGPPDKGEEVMRTLRSFGPVMVDQVSVVPYPVVQSIVENFNPRGMRNYWKTSYLARTSDEAIDIMVEQHLRAPSPLTHQILYSFGGAMARVPDAETAVSHRDARHAFLVIGMWDDASRDREQIAYVRNLWDAMTPFSSGGFYPNYDVAATGDEIKSAYSPEKYARLLALKKKYDPDNFFCMNQNINPAG